MTDTPAVAQIRSHGSGRAGSLANQYEITPQAIRRDLNILCNEKLPQRVPGGAVVPGDIAPCGRPRPFSWTGSGTCSDGFDRRSIIGAAGR